MNQPVFKIDHFTAFLFSSLIFIYTLITLFNISNLELVSRFLLILLTLILCVLIINKYKNYGIQVHQFKFFLPFFLLHILYVLNADIGKLDLGILYQLFFISLVFCLSNITWSRIQIRTLSLFSYITIFVLIAQIMSNSNTLNTNSIGAFAYFLSFFSLLYLIGYTKKNFKIIRLLTIITLVLSVILSSGARSVLICVAVGFITWTFWKFLSRNKFFFYGYFLIILTTGFIFTTVYPYLDKYLPNVDYYNNIVYEYTGKNLFSGREVLWRIMIDIINEKIFFGHGSSVQLGNFLNVGLSAHNLYLQIALQVGVVGVFLFLYFLFNNWKSIWLNRHDVRVKLFACYFLGIIVYQLFELSLLQNHFALSIIQWVIIGLGLSYSFNKSKTPEKENV